MKVYQGKTPEDALKLASEELNIPVEDLIYKVEDKRVGIFNKKYVVDVYELSDIITYAEDYILHVIDAFGIESTVKSRLDDDIIRITIDSTHNPILIGNGGKTLQALNELVKVAVSNHFRRRFRILLDINGYKIRNMTNSLRWQDVLLTKFKKLKQLTLLIQCHQMKDVLFTTPAAV